jgi:hypothetical protein
MGIGKEEIFALEQIARRSVRIYQDACDVGVWETPEIRNAVVAALRGLRELEGGVASIQRDGAEYTTRLAYEHDGDLVSGVEVTVGRFRDRRSKRNFYTFDITPAAWPMNSTLK